VDRAELIQKSLRIFVCGFVSLIPIVGLIISIYTLLSAARLGTRFRDEWNPASVYLRWGTALSVFSLALNVLGGGIFALQL
jgi:hypothetical protein